MIMSMTLPHNPYPVVQTEDLFNIISCQVLSFLQVLKS